MKVHEDEVSRGTLALERLVTITETLCNVFSQTEIGKSFEEIRNKGVAAAPLPEKFGGILRQVVCLQLALRRGFDRRVLIGLLALNQSNDGAKCLEI